MRTLGLRQARRGRLRRPARRHPRHARGLRQRGERLDRRCAAASPRRSSCCSARREPWTPVDSLLWGKTMGLWLSLNWRTELSRQALAGHVPQQMIDELWPDDSGAGHPQALAGPAASDSPTPRRGSRHVLPHFPAPFTLPDTASNEWAVDGRHTATGAPLLAGDPHLAFGFPGIWYLARIDTPGRHAGRRHRARRARSWCSATTATSPGPSPPPAPTPRTCSSRPRSAPTQYQTPDGPQALRHAPGDHQGPRPAGRGADRPRNPPRPGDQRPAQAAAARSWRVAMANLRPGDTAAAGLFALNHAQTVAAGRRGGGGNHLAGAEPAGGRPPDHRAVRHRPGADPPRRRRQPRRCTGGRRRMTGSAGPPATSCRTTFRPPAAGW